MNWLTFNWQTDHIPTDEEIADEQEQRGYHPAGYGGPWCINTKIVAFNRDAFNTVTNPLYETTWICSGTCD